MATDDDTLTALRQENLELRARLAVLEQTGAKFEALVRITPDIIVVLDDDGRYLEIVPTQAFPSERIERLLGATLHDRFPAAVADEMTASVRRTLATGEAQSLEYPVPQATGELRHTARITPLTPSSVLWLAQDVTAARQLQRAQDALRTFEAIVENSPDGVAIVGADGDFVYSNPAYRALLGAGAADLPTSLFFVHVDAPIVVADALGRALADGAWEGFMTIRRVDTSGLPSRVSMVRLASESGPRLAVIARDLSPFVEAERQRVVLQEQVIAAQRTALRELSTPLLPLARGVLAIPLIGTLDAARAQELMEKLLEGIVHQRAHTAILDVTGIRTLDSQAAGTLVGVARAARLLGARIILSGIGPAIAEALVDLQVDLGGMRICSTLQSGIAEALEHRVVRGDPTRLP